MDYNTTLTLDYLAYNYLSHNKNTPFFGVAWITTNLDMIQDKNTLNKEM